jgi:hypothetical protein
VPSLSFSGKSRTMINYEAMRFLAFSIWRIYNWAGFLAGLENYSVGTEWEIINSIHCMTMNGFLFS